MTPQLKTLQYLSFSSQVKLKTIMTTRPYMIWYLLLSLTLLWLIVPPTLILPQEARLAPASGPLPSHILQLKWS